MTKHGDTVDGSGHDASQLEHEEAYCSACNQSFASGTQVCPNDGARLITLAAQRDDLIGRVLDGRYEIRAPLGKGGMGTVYRGWQLSVDREVAIKVIHPKLSDDRSAVKRFLREARLASRLSQPNIVNVYDFGQSESVLYLVMELLRGHTLASELGHGRRLNAKRTVTIALQLCDALEAAHAQGIVHRDLKPSNIVILDDPPGRDLIKVLDFGLAKSLVQDSGSVVTNTDALLGTPLYMAPEQIEGKASDQRADLYSLGCILYEMLTGKPPFVDGAVSAVLARHMHDEAVALPAQVPPKLRGVVEGLLAKRPEDRVQSARDVRRALDDVRDASSLATTLPLEASAPLDSIADVSPGLAETHAAPSTPVSTYVLPAPSLPETGGAKPRRYAIVAFFAIIPIGVLAFVMFNNSNKSSSEPPALLDHGSGPATNVVPPITPDPVTKPQLDSGVSTETVAVPLDGGVEVKTPGKKQQRPRQHAKPDGSGSGLIDPDLPLDFAPPPKTP